MPVFRYSCACGFDGDRLVASSDAHEACPTCERPMTREFSPTTALRLAPWMTREAEDGQARHRAWLERPEVQARIKTGALDVDLSDRHCESGDGIVNSSSVIDRATEGLRS